MKITAKQNARKWTKERLKRHPGFWEIERIRGPYLVGPVKMLFL